MTDSMIMTTRHKLVSLLNDVASLLLNRFVNPPEAEAAAALNPALAMFSLHLK